MEKDIASLKANGLHVEEGRGSEDPITNLKVDKHGLPLVPQPTDSPCDPFVNVTESITATPLIATRIGRIGRRCTWWFSSHYSASPYRVRVNTRQGARPTLIHGSVGAALINPALVELAEDLHVSVEKASYCTTVYLLFGGVTPLFVVPFANIYGRRMLYIVRL